MIEALGPLLRTAARGRRSSATTTTGPPTPATSRPPRRARTRRPTTRTSSSTARPPSGSPVRRTTATPATRAAQTALHDAFPDKGIWFTECSGSHGPTDTPAQFFRGTLTWHARTLMLGTTRNWAKSVSTGTSRSTPTGGPHIGGCDTCTGLVTLQPDGTVTTDAEYYTIGHLSKFVKPGAVRIASTSFGTTGWNGQFMDVAFRNPDGSTALLVHNENDDPRTFAVAVGDQSFDYTLPGGSIATFTWPRPRARRRAAAGVPDGRDRDRVADRQRTRGSRSTTTARPLVQPAGARRPASTCRSTSAAAKHFRRVAIDSGGNLGDYARAGSCPPATTAPPGARSRRARAPASSPTSTSHGPRPLPAGHHTGTSGNWWSLADLRLYA